MSSINNIAFNRVLTHKLHIKADGSAQYKNHGDIKIGALMPDITRIDVVGTEKGYTTVRAKLLSTKTDKYEFTLLEQTPENLALIYLADGSSSANQAAATNLTATFSAVNFREAYALNKVNVLNVVIKDATTLVTRVRDVDYYLDEGAGYFEIIRGGAIASGDNLVVTYDCSQTNRLKFVPNQKRITTGQIKILGFDQNANDPLEQHEFYGQFFITDRGTGDSSKVEEIKMEVYPLRSYTVVVRDIQ